MIYFSFQPVLHNWCNNKSNILNMTKLPSVTKYVHIFMCRHAHTHMHYQIVSDFGTVNIGLYEIIFLKYTQ